MASTDAMYEACRELFASYPLATSTDDDSGTVQSMVLMLLDGSDIGFFVLLRDSSTSTSAFSLHPWREATVIHIRAAAHAAVPGVVADVITRGVPIPRHGSLFGWHQGTSITALIAFYAEHSRARPLPSWAVMPRVGSPEEQWPPFTQESFFGTWFWEHYTAGRIIPLGHLIAEFPETVFWIDTKSDLGSDCCVVARNVSGPDGLILRRGRYTYHQPLRAGWPVPSLATLLSHSDKTDLATRFEFSGPN